MGYGLTYNLISILALGKSFMELRCILMVVHNPHVSCGYKNIFYVGQGTNAAIESYHGTLKVAFKYGKSRMVGR